MALCHQTDLSRERGIRRKILPISTTQVLELYRLYLAGAHSLHFKPKELLLSILASRLDLLLKIKLPLCCLMHNGQLWACDGFACTDHNWTDLEELADPFEKWHLSGFESKKISGIQSV